MKRIPLSRRLPALLLALALALSLSAPALAAGTDRQASAQTAASYAQQYGGAQSVQYAVWENGSLTLTGSVGDYSRTETRALTADNLYGIGSISKIYTTVAIMQLAQTGKLSLDAPVTQYLPAFKMADARYKQITVRELLNHSSGLMGSSTDSAFLFDDADRTATETLLQKLSTQTLKADPGAYSVYCNDGFTLAELVVEAVSGLSFPEYLHENILTPAGLGGTFVPGDAFDTSLLAKTYSGTDTRALPQDCLGIVGAGGVYASASALAAFGGALTGNSLLNSSSRSAMAAAEYAKGIWPADDLDIMSYGLGWDSVKTYPFCQSGIQALVKGGDTLYYHAGLVVIPQYHLAVAVLSSGGSSLYNELAASRMAIDALAAQGVTVDESVPSLPSAQPVETVPAGTKALSGYYGGSQQFLVDIAGGALSLASLNYGVSQTFSYYSDGSFRDEANTALVKLVTERNGQTYLYQKTMTTIPGLGTLPTSSYLAMKLPDNEVSAEAQVAWETAMSTSFVPMNEKYSSQIYLQLASPSASSAAVSQAGIPGYVGSGRIVDAAHTLYVPQVPELYGRDGVCMTLSQKNGVTWLTANTSVYMAAAGVKALFAGSGWSYSTIQADGYARWYTVGAAAGRTMTVSVPAGSGFYVYDAKGQVAASSVLWGDRSVTLPAGGLIVFAGAAGTRFHLRFTSAA